MPTPAVPPLRRAVILHDVVAADARPDDLDTLAQAGEIRAVLEARGARVEELIMAPTLAASAEHIVGAAPDLVVNLVESLTGATAGIHLAAALLESLDLPFTGCGSAAIRRTTDKILAKRVMRAAGISTPDWYDLAGLAGIGRRLGGTFIVKSVSEDASLGIDDTSLAAGADRLADLIAERTRRFGGTWFAERYVAGREFNVSLLEDEAGCIVLPIAEIDFVGYAAAEPRIVDYAAKWDEASAAYRNTPSRFDLPTDDDALLHRLDAVARRCWTIFGLSGYGRVDFRVDESGTPWVLEINANPCLAADAGFAKAARRAGLDGAAVLDRLIAAAHRRLAAATAPAA